MEKAHILKSAIVPAIAGLFLLVTSTLYSQSRPPMVRLAKIVVDSSSLDAYTVLLREEVEKSVQLEAGVLTLYAVSEKSRPTHFTILEIYADSAAYRAHLRTPHFLKYKTGTEKMVKSLELIESTPLVPEMKIKNIKSKRRKREQ